MVLRDFVTRAEAYGIDYNIVEAIDSRGRRSKAASVPIGDCSMPRVSPSSTGAAPITDPDYVKRAGLAVCS